MTTRDAVLRALGKKAPFEVLNYDLVDQTDVMDIINREREDVELLEHTLKEGRDNIAITGGGGLKLRPQPGVESTVTSKSCLYNQAAAGSSGLISRREQLLAMDNSSSSTGGSTTHKPRLIQAVFLISFLTLVATSLFTLFDSMTVVEIAYKVHALRGLVKRQHEAAPLSRDERLLLRQRVVTGPPLLDKDELQDKTSRKMSEASGFQDVPKESVDKNWMPIPVPIIANVDASEIVSTQSNIQDSWSCQENSTSSTRIFGLPRPDMDDIIRLTTGSVHRLHLVALDSFAQRRCAGGDYYETELRSPVWESRPPVVDHNNGSYEMELYVDPRFAGTQFVFKVTLLFSRFDGLHQLDPMLSNHEFKKLCHDKNVVSLNLEFVPPRQSDSHDASTDETASNEQSLLEDDTRITTPGLDLHTCTSEDFNTRQWSGRWTRGDKFNPNCSIDAKDSGRLECLKAEIKCEEPWCEGDLGRLDSNGWVYSAHCSFKIFSPDEAWQCLDGKWLFWWSDSDDQENALVRDLLKSVLGLSLPEGRWDGMGRFSNKVFVRPDGTESTTTTTVRDEHDHITTASLMARNLKQQVRMTNMWNANVLSNYDHFQSVISSYFSKFSSPDVVIMNSGLHEGVHWRDWDEFKRDGVERATKCWTETMEAILPTRHPRIIFMTTGAQSLADFNPQLMEMYTSVVLNAYIAALNSTAWQFKVVDGFDNSFSWIGRYRGNQHFVDLMNLHVLLNAICTV
ncbi:unnamed protein product [Calypogeia fissa]